MNQTFWWRLTLPLLVMKNPGFLQNVYRYRIPWEPKTFIFRGYNPYIGGFKTFMFHGFGVQGHIDTGSGKG